MLRDHVRDQEEEQGFQQSQCAGCWPAKEQVPAATRLIPAEPPQSTPNDDAPPNARTNEYEPAFDAESSSDDAAPQLSSVKPGSADEHTSLRHELATYADDVRELLAPITAAIAASAQLIWLEPPAARRHAVGATAVGAIGTSAATSTSPAAPNGLAHGSEPSGLEDTSDARVQDYDAI